MRQRILLATLAIALIPSMSALGGTGYPMKCTSCGYSAEIMIGGGKSFEQITGFCVHAMKFVYVTWERDTKEPEPMGTVWDSATGEKIKVYKCPDCAKPFMPLRTKGASLESPGFNRCPKCGKATFQVEKGKGVSMFD